MDKTRDELLNPERLAALTSSDLLDALNHNHCPDCHAEGSMLEGPSGGCSTNIMCRICGHKFSVCLPWFAERIGTSNTSGQIPAQKVSPQ